MTDGQGHFEGAHGDSLDDIHRYQRRTFHYIQSILIDATNKMPERVLDIGASDAYLQPFFENLGVKYVGVDPLPRSKSVIRGIIENVNLRGSFDLVMLIHVLEHLENPRDALTRAYEMLEDWGVIFIAVPDASAKWAWEYESHFHLYNETVLKRLLENVGFLIFESLTITFREEKKELWVTAQKH